MVTAVKVVLIALTTLVGAVVAVAQVIDYATTGRLSLLLIATGIIFLVVPIVAAVIIWVRRDSGESFSWNLFRAVAVMSATVATLALGTITAIAFNALVSPAPSLDSAAQPRGEFTDPTNGQDITEKNSDSTSGSTGDVIKYSARGTVENLSSSMKLKLLCIVRDEEFNHFAHTAPIADDQWSANVGLGRVNIDTPKKLTLILVTATQPAVNKLNRQLQEDPESYYSYGFGKDLLVGMEPLDEVVVDRVP